MQNTYTELLRTEISNHLYKVLDNDMQDFHNQSSSQTPYHSKHVKDMFDFYLNHVGFTPADFVRQAEHNLIRILYEAHTSFISDRQQFQQLFKEELASNQKFYLRCMKTCLDEHHRLYEVEGVQDRIERNTKEFRDLLQIGLDNHHFSGVTVDFFYTKNSLYKNWLENAGLLQGDKFEEDKLFEIINKLNSKRSYSNTDFHDAIVRYALNYMKDIVERFKTDEDFIDWSLQRQAHMSAKTFFSLLTRESNEESKPYQHTLTRNWIKSVEFRTQLECSDLNLLFAQQPQNITYFIDQLNPIEVRNMWPDSYAGNFNIDKPGYNKLYAVCQIIPQKKLNDEDRVEVIEKMMGWKDSMPSSADMMKDGAIFSVILNYLVAKQIQLAEASPSDKSQQLVVNLLKTYIKHDNFALAAIYPQREAFQDNIDHILYNRQRLHDYKKQLGLSEEYLGAMDKLMQDKVVQYFNQYSSFSHQYNSSHTSILEDIVKVVTTTGMYDVLDDIGIFYKTMEKTFAGARRKVRFDDYPMVFELLSLTNHQGVYQWVFQDSHQEILKKTLWRKSNIIQHFSDQPQIEQIFQVLVDNKPLFKELVLKQKKTLAATEEINKPFVANALEMIKLEHQLPEPLKWGSRRKI